MSLAASLLSPFLLLISAVSADEEPGDARPEAETGPLGGIVRSNAPDWPIAAILSFEPESAWQVHIEQRMTIRVSPRAATPVPRDRFVALPQRSAPRFIERKIGKCLPISGIAGVEPNGANNLILFMRDRRMIAAELEHSCLARAFYSGFYLSPSTDGMVCIDRDTLHSRSGSACKLSRIRQLIQRDE